VGMAKKAYRGRGRGKGSLVVTLGKGSPLGSSGPGHTVNPEVFSDVPSVQGVVPGVYDIGDGSVPVPNLQSMDSVLAIVHSVDVVPAIVDEVQSVDSFPVTMGEIADKDHFDELMIHEDGVCQSESSDIGLVNIDDPILGSVPQEPIQEGKKTYS
jgi:hypothetical protein